MKHAWEFWYVVTSGSHFRTWVSGDKPLQARVDATFRRLRDMWPWVMPYYRSLGGGIGEIRIDHKKVEYRIYGFFEGKTFVILFGDGDKKNQQTSIKAAKKLKASFAQHPPEKEKYDV